MGGPEVAPPVKAEIRWVPFAVDAKCELPSDHSCDFIMLHQSCDSQQEVPVSWIVGKMDLKKGIRRVLRAACLKFNAVPARAPACRMRRPTSL